MIVGSGGVAVPLQLGEPLRSPVLDTDLGKWRRMDPRAIVSTALDTIEGGIPHEIRADYLACYEGDRYVESMRYVRTYQSSCRSSRGCYRWSPRPSRSSTAATTPSSRAPTPSSSTHAYPPVG
jgi:hypothetical protein